MISWTPPAPRHCFLHKTQAKKCILRTFFLLGIRRERAPLFFFYECVNIKQKFYQFFVPHKSLRNKYYSHYLSFATQGSKISVEGHKLFKLPCSDRSQKQICRTPFFAPKNRSLNHFFWASHLSQTLSGGRKCFSLNRTKTHSVYKLLCPFQSTPPIETS